MAKKRNKGRVKKWMQFNKSAVVYIAIILIYTLIMLGVILVLGKNMNGCSSGSLSSDNRENVNIETTMKSGS